MERNENGLFVNRRTVGMGSPSAPFMPGDDSARISRDTEREGCGRDNGMTSPTPREGCKMGECGCNFGNNRQLAMVYAPMQCFRMLYDHPTALMRGTLFEELDKPFEEGM